MLSYAIKTPDVGSFLDGVPLTPRPKTSGPSEFISERAMAVLSRAARRNVCRQQELIMKSSTPRQPTSRREHRKLSSRKKVARKSQSSSAPPAVRQPPKIVIEEASFKPSNHSTVVDDVRASPDIVQCSSAPPLPESGDAEEHHWDTDQWTTRHAMPAHDFQFQLTRPRYRTMSRSTPRARPATTDWDWVRSRLMTRDSVRRPESSMTFDDFLNGLDLDSDEYDTDLEDAYFDDDDAEYDPSGLWHYKNLCRIKGVTPATKVVQALERKGAHFKLSHRCINSEDAATLAHGIRHSEYVEDLNLSNNYLNKKAAVHVTNMMRKNTRIRRLDLSGNCLQYDAGRYIAEMMLSNNCLTHLCLKENKLGDKEALLLAEVLSNNKSLESLDVSHNQFTDDAGEAFAAALMENSHLTSLNLSWNTLCKRAAAAIGRALEINSTLLSLDLSWNGLGDEGAALLGNSLRNNSTLRFLSLAVNHIGGYGSEQLASGLTGGIIQTKKKTPSYGKSDCALQYLNLDRNPLGARGIKVLLSCLEQGRKLKTLSIRQVLLNSEILQQIKRMCRIMKPDVTLLYEGQDLTLQLDAEIRRSVRVLNEKLHLQKTSITNIIKALDQYGHGVEASDLRNAIAGITQSLTEIELEYAIKGLDADKDGIVHYKDLAAYCTEPT